MQVDQSAAQLYARAVFNIAKERGAIEGLALDVDSTIHYFESEQGRRVLHFWESPAVPTENHLAMVDKLFKGPDGSDRVSPLLQNMARLLIRRLRIENFLGILREIKRLVNEERGLKPGRVTTAYKLADAEKFHLQKKLEKLVSSGLAIEFEVKPSIIGGVIFKFQDQLYDDSVRSRLEELRARLLGVRVSQAESGGVAQG